MTAAVAVLLALQAREGSEPSSQGEPAPTQVEPAPKGGEPALRVRGWKALHPGESDIDHVLTVSGNPNVVYAITGGGFGFNTTFKSTDRGATWDRLVDPELDDEYLDRYGVLSISDLDLLAIDPADPRRLYGTAGDIVGGDIALESTDGGAGWTPANRGLPGGVVTAIVVDPTAPQTLYASDRFDGVYKSTNGGRSWSRVWRNSEDTVVEALAIDPKRPSILYAGARENVFGATGRGLFKSTDGGKSWRRMARWSFEAIAVDPRKPATVYSWYPTQPGLPDKSTNGGKSWSELSLQAVGLPSALHLDDAALAIDPSRPDTVYVAAGDFETEEAFVLKSTTGGESWAVVARLKATGDDLPVVFNSLAVDPTGRRVYAGSDSGGLFACETCWKIESPARRRR